MSNIAEGFERGSRKEFVQFLNIAKGSNGEVRSQLYVALDQEYLTALDLKPECGSSPSFQRIATLSMRYLESHPSNRRVRRREPATFNK